MTSVDVWPTPQVVEGETTEDVKDVVPIHQGPSGKSNGKRVVLFKSVVNLG